MYNGIINVYKEPGYTSFDVVARLRGILHQKKIGHTGTLDPDAEGVLPVVLGNATKLVDALTDKTKTYECIMQLGVETDTEGVQREERVRKSKAATAIQKQTGYDRATSKKIASDIDTVKAGSHRFDDFETQGRAPASRESLRDKLLDPEIEGVVKAHSSATTPKFKYKTDDSVSRAIATSDKLDNARDSMPKNAKDARKAISDVRDTVQTSGHKTLTTQQKGRTLDDDSVVDAIRNKK
jgi:hypothetical protein